MSLKNLTLFIAATAIIPITAHAQGIHGNGISGQFGVFSGDLDINGVDPDSAWALGGGIDYFFNDNVYTSVGITRSAISYSDSSGEVTISENNFSLGVGYEQPIDQAVVIYTQASFLTGGGTVEGEDNSGGTASGDASVSGVLTQFGLRGSQGNMHWTIGTGYQTVNVEYDDNINLPDDSDSSVTFGGGVQWEVSDQVYVGPTLSTDMDVHTLSGVVRYSF